MELDKASKIYARCSSMGHVQTQFYANAYGNYKQRLLKSTLWSLHQRTLCPSLHRLY